MLHAHLEHNFFLLLFLTSGKNISKWNKKISFFGHFHNFKVILNGDFIHWTQYVTFIIVRFSGSVAKYFYVAPESKGTLTFSINILFLF